MSDNNIVTLENLNEIDINLMNKTTTKGKLFKGPNWTAYNKENLGSIPQKIEKALIEGKNNKNLTKIGFNTQSERFFPKKNKEKNPGPGSYNISKDLTRTSTSFYSSKGFGNGFVSQSDRFNNSSLYYSKYSPGPGEYQPQEIGTIGYKVSKSLLAKSLYNNKKNVSLKNRNYTPGPGQYNINNNFKWNQLYKSSFFASNAPRFNKRIKDKIPDPGKYYKDEYYIDINDKEKRINKENYYFKKPKEKKVDLLKKYKIKTEQNKEDIKFKLHEKKGRIYNINGNSINPFTMNKQDIYKIRNKSLNNKLLNNNNKIPNYTMRNFGFSNEDEIQYIHKVLNKTKKDDIFKLNAPRWKKDEYEFKIPGPAYYHPKIQYKSLSFNRNNIDFIVTPGLINEKGDDFLLE